jgi:hypothetical protein
MNEPAITLAALRIVGFVLHQHLADALGDAAHDLALSPASG